mmetsp:Transcript_57153/g.159080  ORF Transcript_57153/g.159080 Transcript_57153/m.159080 type:complete len:214 (+) Transcript_57153:481-1122(+)
MRRSRSGCHPRQRLDPCHHRCRRHRGPTMSSCSSGAHRPRPNCHRRRRPGLPHHQFHPGLRFATPFCSWGKRPARWERHPGLCFATSFRSWGKRPARWECHPRRCLSRQRPGFRHHPRPRQWECHPRYRRYHHRRYLLKCSWMPRRWSRSPGHWCPLPVCGPDCTTSASTRVKRRPRRCIPFLQRSRTCDRCPPRCFPSDKGRRGTSGTTCAQ